VFAFARDEQLNITDFPVLGSLMGLPAGDYVVIAKTQLTLADTGEDAMVDCKLEVGTFADSSAVYLSFAASVATLPFSAAVKLPSGGGAMLSCDAVVGAGDVVLSSRVKLTAMRVNSVSP
jgi:hypothetical protein